jgi:hypothetical protein
MDRLTDTTRALAEPAVDVQVSDESAGRPLLLSAAMAVSNRLGEQTVRNCYTTAVPV